MRGRMHGLLAALVLCYFTISSIAGKASSCIPEERDALLAFKSGVKDPGGKLRSWQGQDCCNWSGVACSNKTLHVIRLDVSHYGLQGEGEINSSLAALTRLAYLDLSDNNFGGLSIPEFLGSFKKLRYLDLSHAYFGGKVPPQLGNLSTLEHLDLNSFSSSSTIRLDSFHWVSRLTSLTYLDLGWVYLAASSDWLQALSKLPSLKVLHLNDAFLPATDLNSISHVNFTALTVLNLTNNELNSCLPNWIWGLNSLSYLDLSGCQLSGLIPYKIENLTSLELLQLRNNHLTGEIPQAMRRLCSLKYIDLSMNNLYGDTAVTKNLFHCMKQLYFLDLYNNNLTGSLSDWLEDLTTVTHLDISYNIFSGQVPQYLGKLRNLTHLDLSSNAFEGVLSEMHIGDTSSLYFLSLALNNLKIAINPKWMPPFQLRVLILYGCRVGPYFPNWLQSQTKIEMVDLDSTEIVDTLPDWLCSFSSSITHLDLSNNCIAGRLPTSLEQMKMLQVFNMRSNQLVGRIPDLPASVEVLDLSRNLLSGSLPQSLGNHKGDAIPVEIDNLLSLDLSGNNISGTIPEEIGNLLSLWSLDLSGNNISGTIPEEIGNLLSLSSLDLSENHISGIIPEQIGNLLSLSSLDLSQNGLSGSIPSSLANLSNLAVLNLSYNDLSGRIPTTTLHFTFANNSFLGNANLCGPPLSRICLEHRNERKHRHKIDGGGAYLCAMLGFAYGLSVVSVILLCSGTARKAYFQFTDSKLDEFRTVVEIKLNRFKAGRCQSMEARRVSNQNSITCYELEFGSPAPDD